MAVLHKFYTVISNEEKTENSYQVLIELNKNHSIFEGHFPGNPVTPGVCMIQIIKELVEEITQQKWRLNKLSNVKFMAIINPQEHPILHISLDIQKYHNRLRVKGMTVYESVVALKLSAEFENSML
ncbi:3-hydroxyacyl-ACP dehydratase [Weeksella virosa]|uniref:Beta-hydroxyacyl-(Acyl-carrier-protein) dehydratase, FabA/FabZ n=1 Tax=Weeksella virosa (strain ATCC 43766 / DSM 16922 / JCM 21250 / CCUG 30538 / CDC 9751 / IAM 14551 / NBRC 16016 / NCTC 11634 / CL345/78) TaxID=865938 RepID=F0NZ52_WEEVC|nr:3-hydroxyacyl-ACP dehydratase [Weeksella virosa]ADX68269.1 beta-hydroxyacyl-(acyl-carrier-protein) dehydratase, FabA/FabZ [Weeksella virosa DSM 16922]MDK7674777.1 3-hydroxyacyl-ACP dehydratase [Weeksella virosa]SUP54582.1 (3R)-hydroxymyristoyl-ACP dehydratase [Weeksella virosa]VEH64094.1 (3R)-hydroxymyristoyl-ACP dehydratase [Weeksella virosa]